MDIPAAIRDLPLYGGHPALDFVNTLHSWVDPAPRDYWTDIQALVGWHQRLGLLDPTAADAFVALDAATADQLLIRARRTRHRLHALFARIAAGRPPSRVELQWLEERLVHLAPFRHLDLLEDTRGDGGAVTWAIRPDPAQPESLMAPALFATADLLAGEDLARVKACPPPAGCGWLFLDRSRNGRRVWCNMKACGNAAKVRRFRERQRT